MRILFISAVLVITTAALADSTVEQKTQVHFGGALGGMINTFGGKATREGLTSTTVIKGNRKLSRTGDRGDLVDLDAEKVYAIDFAGKTYTVTTFDELRKRFQEGQERAAKRTDAKKDQQQGPEWDVDFDIKSTGKKDTVNGWDTHEEIATVTVHEKGKKIQESGGFILTSDMWMGPKIAAMHELAEFEARFVQKVYGDAMNAEMVKMAAAMATQPAFGKAMKAFGEHRGKLEGSPVRTTMTFDMVPGPATQSDQASNDSAASSPAAALLGGLMRKAKDRQAAKDGQSGDHGSMMDSLTEVLRATNTASSADVAIPEGFRLK